jgi:hypothetical protein
VDQARQVTHPDYAPQFLALEFEEMITFSVFMTAGVIFRRNPAAHKRLMILSAVAISDAGFARIWLMGIKKDIPGLFGWWLQYFWGIFLILVAMGVWDLWRRRRIHPAVLFGATLLWAGEIITTILNFSPTWRELMVRHCQCLGLCRLNLTDTCGRLRRRKGWHRMSERLRKVGLLTRTEETAHRFRLSPQSKRAAARFRAQAYISLTLSRREPLREQLN